MYGMGTWSGALFERQDFINRTWASCMHAWDSVFSGGERSQSQRASVFNSVKWAGVGGSLPKMSMEIMAFDSGLEVEPGWICLIYLTLGFTFQLGG